MLYLLDEIILYEKQILIDNEIENRTNDYDLEYNTGTFYYLTLINEKEYRKSAELLNKSLYHCKECVKEENEDMLELYSVGITKQLQIFFTLVRIFECYQ